jgi:hypothetical protein
VRGFGGRGELAVTVVIAGTALVGGAALPPSSRWHDVLLVVTVCAAVRGQQLRSVARLTKGMSPVEEAFRVGYASGVHDSLPRLPPRRAGPHGLTAGAH